MSLTSTPTSDGLTVKQSRRNVHVFDSANVEGYFRRPSADELNVTSEMRVLEIIEDLKKQTSDELENWSQGQKITYAPLPPLKVLKPFDSTDKEGCHSGDMVSSPISLTSPLAESNLIPVPRSYARTGGRADQSTPDTQSTKQTKERQVQRSAEKKDPFSFPDKPAFQSFLKRVAKTPPPPAALKDYTICPLEKLPASLESTQPHSDWPDIDSADDYDEDEICVRIVRSATPPAPPKFATQRDPYKKRQESAAEDLEMLNAVPQASKSRPRSNSLPLFVIKRKPLPKDSPLYVPSNSTMKRSPTFDDIVLQEPIDVSSPSKNRSQSESAIGSAGHDLTLAPFLVSALSRGKSIRKKLKGQARNAYFG